MERKKEQVVLPMAPEDKSKGTRVGTRVGTHGVHSKEVKELKYKLQELEKKLFAFKQEFA